MAIRALENNDDPGAVAPQRRACNPLSMAISTGKSMLSFLRRGGNLNHGFVQEVRLDTREAAARFRDHGGVLIQETLLENLAQNAERPTNARVWENFYHLFEGDDAGWIAEFRTQQALVAFDDFIKEQEVVSKSGNGEALLCSLEGAIYRALQCGLPGNEPELPTIKEDIDDLYLNGNLQLRHVKDFTAEQLDAEGRRQELINWARQVVETRMPTAVDQGPEGREFKAGEGRQQATEPRSARVAQPPVFACAKPKRLRAGRSRRH